MKKYYFLFSLLLASAASVLASNENDALQYDEQKIEAEFNQLNQLEKHVATNPGTTLDEVSASNAELIQDMVLEGNAIAAVMAEAPLNIPPFWWGLCLGWVGLLVVYIVTDNDRDQVKKAFTGCLINTGIGLVLYLLIYGAALGSGI